MRKILLTLNSILLACILAFFSYTFFAKEHLESLAREFATEKTIKYSKPIVGVAEESLDSPLAKKLISKDKIKVIEDEIARYWLEPENYIRDLTENKNIQVPEKKLNPFMTKIVSVKNRIRKFYTDILEALIRDIRIFSFSNIVASMVGLLFAYWSRNEVKKTLVIFSLLTFVSVIYCSSLYISEMTFFRILFRTHLGWSYPVLVVSGIVMMYLSYQKELHFFAGEQVEAAND